MRKPPARFGATALAFTRRSGSAHYSPPARSRPLSAQTDIDPPSRLRQVALLAAWALVVFIVFATLGPQRMRPHLARASLERFGAFFLLAAAFTAAYPKRPWAIAAAAVGFAVVLELGQFVAVGRDPGVKDVIEKALGGMFGVAVAVAVSGLDRRRPES
jgi:VanZ family protein